MWLVWLVPLPEEGFTHSLQMFLATRNAFSELIVFLWFLGTWAPACFLGGGERCLLQVGLSILWVYGRSLRRRAAGSSCVVDKQADGLGRGGGVLTYPQVLH